MNKKISHTHTHTHVRGIKTTKTPSANNQNGFSSIINRNKNVKNVEEN